MDVNLLLRDLSDTTVLRSARVDSTGTRLALTFSRHLDLYSASAPPLSAFTVHAEGRDRRIGGYRARGRTARLTGIVPPILQGRAVLVSYTDAPLPPSRSKLPRKQEKDSGYSIPFQHFTEREMTMSDLTIRSGRSLGVLTPTPEDDDGTCELLLSAEVGKTFHDYALLSQEANLDRDPADHWRELGFEGSVHGLLRQMLGYRGTPASEEIVRLFTIDEAEHGPLDVVIEEIHGALRRVEASRERARKT